MLKGQLWATSDANLVNQAMTQGYKVIYLGDPVSLTPDLKEKFVMATSLTPDYETLSLMVDGNIEGFVNMYLASLNSKVAMEMLSAILACLYKGINVIFYLPQEASSLDYAQYLLQFIEYNFGIITQTKNTQFNVNPSYFGRIIELLYLNNLVSAQEFLVNSKDLDNMTLRKLVVELHPMVKDPTDLKQIIAWFSNYKDELLKSNKPLINGIQYAGKESDYACFS